MTQQERKFIETTAELAAIKAADLAIAKHESHCPGFKLGWKLMLSAFGVLSAAAGGVAAAVSLLLK